MKSAAFSAIAATVICASSLMAARPASADTTAVGFLAQYAQWAQKQQSGPGIYYLKTNVVTIAANGQCSYAEALLQPYTRTVVSKTATLSGIVVSPYLLQHGFNGDAGTLGQLFNDRRYGAYNAYPFNPGAEDKLGIDINTDNGSVTFTLKNWNNQAINVDLHYLNGVLVGAFNNPADNGLLTSVMISVNEQFNPLL